MQLRGIGGAPLERFPGPTVSTVPCMLVTQNTFSLLWHDSSLSGLPLFFRSVCSSFELLLLDLMLVLSSWVPLPYLWHIGHAPSCHSDCAQAGLPTWKALPCSPSSYFSSSASWVIASLGSPWCQELCSFQATPGSCHRHIHSGSD